MNISLTHILLIQAGLIMAVGLFGIITRKNIFKVLLSINIMQTGVNLLLIGLGFVENGKTPIIIDANTPIFVDPLPHALVLTSIVIGFGTTALGLVVMIRYYLTHKTLDYTLPEYDEKEGEIL